VDRICLVGFSTGASLSLQLATEQPAKLAGIAALCTPLRFKNRNMVFVPFVHGTNRLVSVVREEGVLAFRPNPSEHPHINYVHMPIRALYELGRLTDNVKKRLSEVQHPVLIMQGDTDPIVEPESALLLHRLLGTHDKRIVMVRARRHGILHNNVDATWQEIFGFLERFDRPE
jgi:esterase/lipase